MPNIVETFKELIGADKTLESDIQNFLEQNSELIYTPFLLHHYLHHESVISKFPLDTGIVTDFAYLTMDSGQSCLVLVELENPNKRLFTKNPKQVTTTAEFNSALAQIQEWKEFVSDNLHEVIRRLGPLLGRVMASDYPVYVKYVLVIGRRHEIENHNGRRRRLATLNTDELKVLTYDSLISAYEEGPKFKKNILSLTKGKYRFKYLLEPSGIFARLLPQHLELTKDQKNFLIKRGFEIEEWERGKLLGLNGKKPIK